LEEEPVEWLKFLLGESPRGSFPEPVPLDKGDGHAEVNKSEAESILLGRLKVLIVD
jgi:hypothetical protein